MFYLTRCWQHTMHGIGHAQSHTRRVGTHIMRYMCSVRWLAVMTQVCMDCCVQQYRLRSSTHPSKGMSVHMRIAHVCSST